MNHALTIPVAINDAPGSAVRTLRQRCKSLGLPTWHCDRTGTILEEPDETSPAALLLGARPITRLVVEAAKTWGGLPPDQTPEIVELFPGCWGLPLAENRRGSRIGCLVAIAFSPASLNEEVFLAACGAAQLDVHATRRSLLTRARYDRESVRNARDALAMMAADLTRLQEHDGTVSGFARQLTDCFETIDLLYTLGRSMNDLTRPANFVQNLCDRVRSTLPFGWVGAWFSPTERLGEAVSGRLFTSGTPKDDTTALTARLAESISSPAEIRPWILTELNGRQLPDGGQILVHPVQRGGSIIGALVAGDKHGDDPQVSSYDIQLLEAAAGYVGAFLDNAVLYADQQALFLGTLEALTASIDAKDRYTCGHSQRVAQLSTVLALAAGMSPAQADRVRIAGLVHDVGKIGVPEAVLTKSGRLTPEEYDAIKQHPAIGHRILKDIRLLEDVLPGVLHHHERWDGKGYPHGLAATAIPYMARIIALADSFDAMSSNRSYRDAAPRHKVLEEVRRCAGSQFDADLVNVFVGLDFAEYDQMVARHAAEQPDALRETRRAA